MTQIATEFEGLQIPEQEEPISVEELNALDAGYTIEIDDDGSFVNTVIEQVSEEEVQSVRAINKLNDSAGYSATTKSKRQKIKYLALKKKQEVIAEAVANGIEEKDAKIKNLSQARDFADSILTFVTETGNQNSLLYYFDVASGIYKEASEVIAIIGSVTDLAPGSNGLYRQLYNQVKIFADEVEWTKDPNLIPVANGYYNLQTKSLNRYSADVPFNKKIATAYNPEAKNVKIDNWDLDSWLEQIMGGDKKKERLLLEIVQEAINSADTRRKIVFFTGSGMNGKGTFQSALENLIGQQHVSHIKPDQMSGTHDLHAMADKILNIGDDINANTLKDVSTLKTVASGDSIQINPKGRDLYSTQIKALNIFSANELPKANDKTDAWLDRLIIMPFTAQLKGRANRKIKTDYLTREEVLEYLLKKAIAIGAFEKFTEVQSVREAVDEYKKENNSIPEFVEEILIKGGYTKLGKLTPRILKRLYREYTDEDIKQPAKLISQELNKQGIKSEIKPTALTVKDKNKYGDLGGEGLNVLEGDYMSSSVARMVVIK